MRHRARALQETGFAGPTRKLCHTNCTTVRQEASLLCPHVSQSLELLVYTNREGRVAQAGRGGLGGAQ